MVYSMTTRDPRVTHKDMNSKHNTDISSLFMTCCTGRGSNCLDGRIRTLTWPSIWWMRNHDSPDQDTLFRLSMLQSQCSQVPFRCSLRWCLVNRGMLVRRLLHNPIINSAHWTLCLETLVLGSALYWAVSRATVRCWFCFTILADSNTLFSFDDVWVCSALASDACFTVMHPCFINIRNNRLQATYQLCTYRDTHSTFSSHLNLPFIKFT